MLPRTGETIILACSIRPRRRYHYSSPQSAEVEFRPHQSWILRVNHQTLAVDLHRGKCISAVFYSVFSKPRFRCTRIHNPDYIPEYNNGRHSSSADEGFTSGSSPVNGAASGSGSLMLSPQSTDTAHLVSSSSASTASSTSSSSSAAAPKSKPQLLPKPSKAVIADCLARESTVWSLFLHDIPSVLVDTTNKNCFLNSLSVCAVSSKYSKGEPQPRFSF